MTKRLPVLEKNRLQHFVQEYFERKEIFLDLVEKFGSPIYVVDPEVIRQKAHAFRQAFSSRLPNTRFYYAVKSNNMPYLSKIILDQGFGLDISSGMELAMALSIEAEDIIFSGPGKTVDELSLALSWGDKVTLLLDSPGELSRLSSLARERELPLSVGIRLNSNPDGLWRKFGVMPDALNGMLKTIQSHPFLTFKGFQFHSSWNLTPERQVDFIALLGTIIENISPAFRQDCEFIDIGGGYWPPQGEWLVTPDDPLCHRWDPGATIDIFADAIASAIETHITPRVNASICFEPGRWICNDAVHLIMQVVDKKEDRLVITDAGTNTVGWERFETDYFPVLNLTRPALEEFPCHVLGSLCTPHDVWGYACFGQGIEEEDILMIPTQGAYTYSLKQSFIKPLPKVVSLENGGILIPETLW